MFTERSEQGVSAVPASLGADPLSDLTTTTGRRHYTYGRVLRTQEPGSQPQVLSQLAVRADGQPQVLSKGGGRERECMEHM